MADVLDYASQQGDDIGIYIAFILAFLIYFIPVGFVGYWAIKFVGYMTLIPQHFDLTLFISS